MDLFISTPLSLQIAFTLLIGFLMLMTGLAWAAQWLNPARWSDALLRIRTWWFIVIPTLLALLFGWQGVTLFFAFVSFLALREYLSLVPLRREDRPLIARIPNAEAGPAGSIGLVLLLLLTTQLNDALQYIWGKMLGKYKIIPAISPNKTRAGLVGGGLSCALLFFLLSPYLSPFSLWQALILGLSLPLIGFFGDAGLSAFKRDLGVKDSSNFLPGHGGILDRVDSLMFTAPWFFHFTAYWHVSGY